MRELYIVAESYGGKFAVTTALAALKAIRHGLLDAKLGGVALGDSWISPEDSVLSWGPLLYQVSRIDENGQQHCDRIANRIKEQLKAKQYAQAEKSWEDLETAVLEYSNSVNFYNFLKDESSSDAAAAAALRNRKRSLASVRKGGYTSYLSSKVTREGGLDGLMDTVVKAKLGIIPKNLTWGEQSNDVFEALEGDFMKPRIRENQGPPGRGVGQGPLDWKPENSDGPESKLKPLTSNECAVPPQRSWLSRTSTSWPYLARKPAQHSPQSPLPITTTSGSGPFRYPERR